MADRFYIVSMTDKEAILKVEKDEYIRGILVYISDPVAFPAVRTNLWNHIKNK